MARTLKHRSIFLALLFIFTALCSAVAINAEPKVDLSDPANTYTVHDGPSAYLVPSQQQLDYFITGPKLTLELYGQRSRAAEDPRLEPGVIHLVLSYLLTEEARDLRDSIKEIQVEGSEVGSVVLGLLTQVIERVPVVRVVHWAVEGPIPPEVFTALTTAHPKVIVYFSIFAGAVPACHPSKHALTANASYGCTPDRDSANVMPSTLRLLQTCPSIKMLQLTIEWCGCVLSLGDHYAFDLSDTTKWAANLTSLGLDGYAFDEDPQPESYRYGEPWTRRGLGVLVRNLWEDLESVVEWVGELIIDAFRIEWIVEMVREWRGLPMEIEGPRVTNLDRWMEVMDWRALRRLSIKNSPVKQLTKLGGVLTSLMSFELERSLYGMRWDNHVKERAAVLEFLSLVGPLKRLGLSGMGGSMPMKEVLERHGPTLESLKLHEKEVYYDPTVCGRRERDTLSVEELEMIRDMCPKLERLEVDVDRNRTWPSDILTTLATFPTLSHLALNLQLGILNETYILPRLDNTTALHIFNSLRAQKIGEELKSVKLVLGEWGEHKGGGDRLPGWDEERRGFYECVVKDGVETCWIGGADLCFDEENKEMWPCDEGGKYRYKADGALRDEL